MKNKNKDQKQETAQIPSEPKYQFRILGFRAFDLTENHLAVASLVVRNEVMLKAWVGKMMTDPIHTECEWEAERLAINEEGRLLSFVGDMDKDNPAQGKIRWHYNKDQPFDLGAIELLLSAEQVKELQAAPPTQMLTEANALLATPAIESDAPDERATETKETPSEPIATSSTSGVRAVPKPSAKHASSSKANARSMSAKAASKQSKRV